MGRRQRGETGYHARVARDVGGNARIEDRRGGSILVLTCTGGKGGAEHVVEYPIRAHLPPDMLTRQMADRGWRLGKRVTCIDCMAKEREKKIVATAKPEAAPPPAAQETAAASAAAKRATRLIFMALEDAYDDAKRQYRAGWDDARVAKETGASVAYVAKVREEHFGSIEPAEIVEIRKEISKLSAAIGAAEGRLESEAATIGALKQRVLETEANMGRLAVEKGWAT